ncbi:MAG: hypothetical protein ABEJ84_00095 [Halodesulfurarchaeum sp.]
MSGAAPTREVAYRVFADEFAESTYSYAESDDERAPQYLVTPTGARINRLFVVGVLTETEEVSDGVLRARIVDPTGAFVLYAGQYQPEALAFFERADPPIFVSLTGKARTFEPEGSDRILTSLRPERVSEVDAQTRDSWVVQTALHTLERTGLLAQALELDARGEDLSIRLTAAGVEPGLAAGIPRAIREYEPTTGYLETVQQMALDAIRVVTGEIDEVSGVSGTPSEGGKGAVLTGFADVSLAPKTDESTGPVSSEREESTGTAETESESEEETEAEPTTDSESVEETEAEPAEKGDSDRGTESDRATESESTDGDGTGKPAAESTTEDQTTAVTEDSAESDELYELSEEERAEVEENYDVGFESGTEIGNPEETPAIEPEAGAAESEARKKEVTDETESTAGDDVETGSSGEPDGEATDTTDDLSEEDPEDLVVDTLKELGGGAGVPRSELVETLKNRHDLEEDEIEDAIEAALLGGRCFESGATDLKPI